MHILLIGIYRYIHKPTDNYNTNILREFVKVLIHILDI